MSEENVIELRPGAGAERGVIEAREKETKHGSWHRGFEIDADSRRVYCQQCGEEVDAFSALQKFAASYKHYVNQVTHLHRAVKVAEERLADLKRLERNARSRVRRKTGMTGHELDRAARATREKT